MTPTALKLSNAPETEAIAKIAPMAGLPSNLEARMRPLSPRWSPTPTPWVSTVIHGATFLVWIFLLVTPFLLKGIYFWSAGIIYGAYDTILLILTFWATLRLLRPSISVAATRPRPSLVVLIAARNEARVTLNFDGANGPGPSARGDHGGGRRLYGCNARGSVSCLRAHLTRDR